MVPPVFDSGCFGRRLISTVWSGLAEMNLVGLGLLEVDLSGSLCVAPLIGEEGEDEGAHIL